MRVALEKRDYPKYPFLKEAKELIDKNTRPLDRYLKSQKGKKTTEFAFQRLLSSIEHERDEKINFPKELEIEDLIASFYIARVIVSCINDRGIFEKFIKFESSSTFKFFFDEDEGVRNEILNKIGLNFVSSEFNTVLNLKVTDYVEMIAGLNEERWRLVNRDINDGYVTINNLEIDELFRERVKVILRQKSQTVPKEICAILNDYADKFNSIYQSKILEDFGQIDEKSYPPCIIVLLNAITSGKNITHFGRFSLTSFLYGIGLNTTQIIELFCRAPDFDIAKTQYQVEHITGRGGTEYTAPSCAAMRTNNLCFNRDLFCETINHPLSYYKKRKKAKKPEPTGTT